VLNTPLLRKPLVTENHASEMLRSELDSNCKSGGVLSQLTNVCVSHRAIDKVAADGSAKAANPIVELFAANGSRSLPASATRWVTMPSAVGVATRVITEPSRRARVPSVQLTSLPLIVQFPSVLVAVKNFAPGSRVLFSTTPVAASGP